MELAAYQQISHVIYILGISHCTLPLYSHAVVEWVNIRDKNVSQSSGHVPDFGLCTFVHIALMFLECVTTQLLPWLSVCMVACLLYEK